MGNLNELESINLNYHRLFFSSFYCYPLQGGFTSSFQGEVVDFHNYLAYLPRITIRSSVPNFLQIKVDNLSVLFQLLGDRAHLLGIQVNTGDLVDKRLTIDDDPVMLLLELDSFFLGHTTTGQCKSISLLS